VYVLDLASRKLLGKAKVDGLPAKAASQFKATNTQYLLRQGWLYIAGGYGPDPKKGTLVTLPYVTAVNFDALVDAVVNRKPLDAKFESASVVYFDHPALAITGGDLEWLPDAGGGTLFVLAFGHQFDGEYTPGGGLVNQQYSDSIRVFRFDYAQGGAKPAKINYLGKFPNISGQMDPENPYHRRDLTLKPTIDASGQRRLAAYGGVFKGGRTEGFVNPIYIQPGQGAVTAAPDDGTVQLLSQYDCAAIQLFDKRGANVYTTFFGGISQYYWDEASQSLKRDVINLPGGVDGLPFINSISTLRMPVAGGAGTQFLHVGQTLPPSGAPVSCPGSSLAAAYLGAETKFVPVSSAPQVTDGVLQLNAISAKSVIGFLVGGIAATAPYSGPDKITCASPMFYQVTLDPSQPSQTVRLQAPAQ
jgi:hypothetical protein